ncbi:MAG: diguanylate cyclase [Heyndrickxia sp.]
MLKDLFINTTIIISFLFLYLHLFRNHLFSKNASVNIKLLYGIAFGILGYILMKFGIHIGNTFIDFRHIPVIIASIFGGFLPGFITLMVITMGKLIMGGFNTSSLVSLVFSVFLSIGCFSITKLNTKLWFKNFYLLTYTNFIFTFTILYLIGESKILKELLPIFWVFSYVAGFFSLYLVEYLTKSFKLFKMYKEQSTQDFLTGLNNYRKFDDKYNSLILDSKEKLQKLSVLYIDIDHFKKVNDTYGHNNGDEILQQLSQILKDSTEHEDIVSRNGGEEFTVLLPNSSIERATSVAEHIRMSIENHHFMLTNGKSIRITVSVGIANFPESTNNIEEIIDLADKALYMAKNSGRNRVHIQ